MELASDGGLQTHGRLFLLTGQCSAGKCKVKQSNRSMQNKTGQCKMRDGEPGVAAQLNMHPLRVFLRSVGSARLEQFLHIATVPKL